MPLGGVMVLKGKKIVLLISLNRHGLLPYYSVDLAVKFDRELETLKVEEATVTDNKAADFNKNLPNN
jgi:hypothetical protein